MLTTFYEAHSGFSLIGVAETQLRMLLDHGYDPLVLVQEQFDTTNPFWQPSILDIRRVIPAMQLTEQVHPEFEQRVQKVQHALRESLGDVGVVETHLGWLRQNRPALVPAYCALGRLTLDLARRKGTVSDPAARRLRRLLG